MKKTGFIILLITLVIGLSILGCGKKQEPLEMMQEPLSMDSLSSMSGQGNVILTPDSANQVTAQSSAQGIVESNLEPLPPAGPFSPGAKEIQSALKKSGYYFGSIDGKIGPKSKRAIEEFQKAHGLKVDGKVGKKTWEKLRPYLQSTGVSQ